MTPKYLLTLPAYLQSTKAPWISLLTVTTGKPVESLVCTPAGFELKIIKGRRCKTPTSLFEEFAKALEFPDYFGHNWDAMEECLADLEWLPAKGYVLLISNAGDVLPDNEEEYETFLEILRDAGEAWGSGQAGMGARRAKPFHALFAVSEQEKTKRAHWGMKEVGAGPT
jgi:RNAse (barnase) inhibitor barstar